MPEIVFITSYPPRECGIATYSQDLVKSIKDKFVDTFTISICALEEGNANFQYPDEVLYTLNTNDSEGFENLAKELNSNDQIQLVMIQHEFGFFHGESESDLLKFMYTLTKPIVIVFHTVLPTPSNKVRINVQRIAAISKSIVVMTNHSAKILYKDYNVPKSKITVIEHGTHLVPHLSKDALKNKYKLKGKKVLSTFGLMSSGKGIETTLLALPEIIKLNPDVIFLAIGKTHPGVIQSEGEQYRNSLEQKVRDLQLSEHVKFINSYLPLQQLLEYLQLTDIYLFTSKDPEQAVSGTFSYAMSCACPIVSTPIPHAKEVLRADTGIIIDFQSDSQLAHAVNYLLQNEVLRKEFSSNTLQRIVPTNWQNAAISYGRLIQKTVGTEIIPKTDPTFHSDEGIVEIPSRTIIDLKFNIPKINLDHIKKLTTEFGMIQFSKINKPDIESGYTLDDNARALLAMGMHYKSTRSVLDLAYLEIYLGFIKFCFQEDSTFLNYVDKNHHFTSQNKEINLSDATGRAIWALGYIKSLHKILPEKLIETVDEIILKALPLILNMHSPRAMAFSIKGLYYFNQNLKSPEITNIIQVLADRLVQMYRHESGPAWNWFESYLTYANSILPEALLCAWIDTKKIEYKIIAKQSFAFLLNLIFEKDFIKVISNNGWLHKGQKPNLHGEQPLDVAYTILALDKFYKVFEEQEYLDKLKMAFSWFHGKNHLDKIIYNPCTGGCFDGLEENYVNLNQGAESTVSYLMARLTIKNYVGT
ncbi:MAG: glycosyltransferase [Saprospiraceae bacterium]|nr:glycosyltransferase [Saprospiraceae bacterium]